MAALLTFLCRVAVSKIVLSAVLPHGDFVYDPSLVHNANGSVELHGNATLLGGAISSAKPDLIFLTSPHGLEDSQSFLLYANTAAAGYAELGQDLHNASFPSYRVPLAVHGTPNISKALVAALPQRNVTELLAFADGEPIALRWGEVIPLTFLRGYLNQSGAGVLTWSMPTRRYKGSGAPMTEELLALGAAVGDHLEQLPEKVAVLISSDLAHTHLATGPYGYSDAAEPFDVAIGEWARTLQDAPLLQTARSLVPKALSCGYTGLVLLHGLMQRPGQTTRWRPIPDGPFALGHPTYYGMLVAGFDPYSQVQLST